MDNCGQLGTVTTFSGDKRDRRAGRLSQRKHPHPPIRVTTCIRWDGPAGLLSDALWLGYTQSHATLLYLWQRFGQGKFVELFNALAVGTKTEQALIDTYNRNYDMLYVEVAQFIQNGCR